MLHPIVTTLIQRPDLLVEHVAAYGELIHEEASQAGAVIVQRYVAWAIAAVCGLVFVLLSGVAVMLGTLQNQFHWVLLAVPGFALVLMLVALVKAKAPLTEARFTDLKAQIDTDIQALRSVS